MQVVSCYTILKYSSDTTNLTDHLRRKHSKFLKEQSESTSSDAKAATVKQTTPSSKQEDGMGHLDQTYLFISMKY